MKGGSMDDVDLSDDEGGSQTDDELAGLVADRTRADALEVHVSQRCQSNAGIPNPRPVIDRFNYKWPRAFITRSAVAVLIAAGLLAYIVSRSSGPSESSSNSAATLQHLSCPEIVAPAENDKLKNFDAYVEDDALRLDNETVFDSFRTRNYDGYLIPYNEAKDNIRDYVTKYFLPPLQHKSDGLNIYESACGTASNLLMTLEILAEHNVTGLSVFGNDYLSDSVQVARQLLAKYMPDGMNVGQICPADSTNLSHVPSNSFDVVFTGYIDPIQDPLGLFKDYDGDDDLAYMTNSLELCKATGEAEVKLAEQEQAAQEAWFARWAEEMIRIAKPGGTIIVEDVAKPLCKALGDWGGVSQSWWAEAAAAYGWDVDIGSIAFEVSTRNPKYKRTKVRYNFAMRKNEVLK